MTNYKLAFMLAACLVCGSLATAACSSGDGSAGAQSKTAPDAKPAATTASAATTTGRPAFRAETRRVAPDAF